MLTRPSTQACDLAVWPKLDSYSGRTWVGTRPCDPISNVHRACDTGMPLVV
ncbi:hypothetical protein F383_17464 [Gossypium arboreum]|uniref:Uncharacterized protein n=1 Tax=Gossypium arboreum TaxID=29729 RepID=A0A0B0NFA4_GOSAR|nr:hypothetical protein F383_17464 [Gossypium arboreum]